MPRTVHRVEVGETVVADRTAVLTVCTAKSAVMIARDRSRRLAAAVHFALPRNRRERARQSRAIPIALFAPLVVRGCQPENVELYAVGPGLPSVGRQSGVVLNCRASIEGGSRRIEFRVDTGRMVVEGDGRT